MVDLKFITELPGASANIVGYGNGTGYKNLICTILLPKKGVKLVFTKALNCLILETYWQELEKDTALQR